MPDVSTTEQSTSPRPTATPGTLQCPTCRTTWRGAAICPRCGTDLTALMQVATSAWRLRQAARAALCDEPRIAEALALAQESCRVQNTPQGQRLVALALLAQGEYAAASDLLACLL